MFKKGLDFVIHGSITDPNGRYIIIDLTLYEQIIFGLFVWTQL